jgi:hypothetical protein
MAEVKINVRGKITRGRWAGQFMTVEDDTERTGGYLIIVEPDTSGGNGGDMWVAKDKLPKVFEEADWEVEWS